MVPNQILAERKGVEPATRLHGQAIISRRAFSNKQPLRQIQMIGGACVQAQAPDPVTQTTTRSARRLENHRAPGMVSAISAQCNGKKAEVGG